MSTETKLQVCGRLLEQSDDDVDVAQEAGRIGVDAIAADAAMSKQPVYTSKDVGVMYQHQGNDPRFLVHDWRVPYVVDTSDGTKNNVAFDFSSIVAIDRPNQQSELDLDDICFVSNDKVLGTVYFNNARFLFAGKFDFVSCRMTINSMISFDDYLQGTFLVNEAKDQVYFLNESYPSGNLIFEVQIANNSLTLSNTIGLPFRLYFPTVRNSRLFGLSWANEEKETMKLFEFSLTDGTKIEHEIKNSEHLDSAPFFSLTYAWTKNTLFTVYFDTYSNSSTIVRLDLRELKCTRTNMEVRGAASTLSMAGCVLTVSSNAVIGDEPEDHYYQFHMNKVDSFTNLIWRSVHQYTHSNPLFTEWFVSKLPINSRFRQ